MNTPESSDQNPLVARLTKALKPASASESPAREPGIPELTTFVGFLGDIVMHPGGTEEWRLLYLDWSLQTWLLVEKTAIVHTDEIKDEKVPGGKVDVIWVKADASVRRGSGSQSVESRFLTGSFTRAADFDAPLTGGTSAPATGVFCGGSTAGCCYRRTRGG